MLCYEIHYIIQGYKMLQTQWICQIFLDLGWISIPVLFRRCSTCAGISICIVFLELLGPTFCPVLLKQSPPKKGKKWWTLETILGFLLGSPTVVSYKLLELLMSSISDLIIVLAKTEPTTGQGGLNYCLEAWEMIGCVSPSLSDKIITNCGLESHRSNNFVRQMSQISYFTNLKLTHFGMITLTNHIT